MTHRRASPLTDALGSMACSTWPLTAAFLLLGSAALAGALQDRSRLPQFETIPAAATESLTPANGWPSLESYRTWTRSQGGPTSNRYSALTTINRGNIAKLKVAWTYRSGDGLGNVQCNPIVVGRTMYAPTSGKHIVALDATCGKELWRFRPESGNALQDIPARRGLLYWPGADGVHPRIIFAAGTWIYALDPETGQPIPSFGQSGRTEIPTAGSAGAVVWRNVLIVPGYLGDVYGYDVVSGKQLWRFHTIPRPGEYGADTWAHPEQGANCWGGVALDEPRGIAYVSTGSPKPNFVGRNRRGDNLFGNCVIALNAATGERLWHFQEVRHDIWNYDIPAPPNLVVVEREGRKVDAVAQVTKLGHTLLLDRVTGEPLFPVRLRRAPESKIPGEFTAVYQPDLELPERFIDHFVTFEREHITDRTPAAREYVEKLVAGARYGTWFSPMELNRPTVTYGDNGGANWPGASFDPESGRLYVTSNELPWIMSILRDDDPPPQVPATAGETAYQQYCGACHGQARRGLGMVPGLLGLRHRMNDTDLMQVMREGRGAMPAMAQVPIDAAKTLADFLFARDRSGSSSPPASGTPYIHAAFRRMLDHEGYPGIKPPWGTLNCIDLNTGKLLWKARLGEHPELKKAGVPKTGTENYGGATTTAGGLVFCSGTRDGKIRAFDSASGDELWAGDLPHDGSTPPTTYEIDGRQYVVIAAMGVRMLRGPEGDAWVAFALPESN